MLSYSMISPYIGSAPDKPDMPSFMEMHPYSWSKEDVYTWLAWCSAEYALSDVPLEKFSMNGKAMCVLTKEDFRERAPNVGDVLYNTLQKIAAANVHPGVRNGLPIMPQMASAANLLMPATMCNTFIPSHFSQLFGQTYLPMTPDSSPSGPNQEMSPHCTAPITEIQRTPPVILTHTTNDNPQHVPVTLHEVAERRESPHGTITDQVNNADENRPSSLPLLSKCNPGIDRILPSPQNHHSSSSKCDSYVSDTDDSNEPLNLSKKPSEVLINPSPPLLTPNTKYTPYIPGAGLQAAYNALFPKTQNPLKYQSPLTVPLVPLLNSRLASTTSMPLLLVQKRNQSGGEMIINNDAPYDDKTYSKQIVQTTMVKEETEMERNCLDLSPQREIHRGPSNEAAEYCEPITPSDEDIGEEDNPDLETPFTPPVTPGGTLLGFNHGNITPNGTVYPQCSHGAATRPDGSGKLLWEFLSELLNDPDGQSDPKPIVKWLDCQTYTFQILDTGRLSRLWGQQKNRGTMNYEKLSRALRYYKKVGIIEKAPGKRLTYKFMQAPSSIKRGQRGARPGVPRKNRRTSLLQSQMSVDSESDFRKVKKRSHTPSSVGTPEHDKHISPLHVASTFTRMKLQQRLRGIPPNISGHSVSSTNNLPQLPLTTPPITSLISPAVVASATNKSLLTSALLGVCKTENNDNSATSASNVSFPHCHVASLVAAPQMKLPTVPISQSIQDRSQEKDISNNKSNKAVHLGMPITVPTYSPSDKSNPTSTLHSLSRRRHAQLTKGTDGNVPKKIPRLILPKPSGDYTNSNNNNNIEEPNNMSVEEDNGE